MTRPTNTDRIPIWHSLMYSSGFLLLVGGTPMALWCSLLIKKSDKMLAFFCIGVAEVLVGGVLLFVARWITKHRQKEDEKDVVN